MTGAFPFVGALFVMLVALPALAVVARLVFVAARRFSPSGALHGNTALRYGLLVLPPVLPLVYLASSAVHQAELGACADVCDVAHADPFCPEPVSFAAIVAALMLLRGLPAALAFHRSARGGGPCPRAPAIRARVRRLLADGPYAWLARRVVVVVVDGAEVAISTRGLLRAHVVLRADFADDLRDDELAAALAHEAEHVRAGDSLRYAIGWISLRMNPLVWALLGRELARWVVAREIHCDREAVLRGASPTALASALVAAARSSHASQPCCALATPDRSLLELRVRLLLAYCEEAPKHCCHEPALRITALALVGALLLPHVVGSGALDVVHVGSESVVTRLLGK